MDLLEVKENNGLASLLSHISKTFFFFSPGFLHTVFSKNEKFNTYFEIFLTVVNYLAKLYCICILWKAVDVNQISNIIPINDEWRFNDIIIRNEFVMDQNNHYQFVWLKYIENFTTVNNTDDIIEMGIDSGCQVRLVKYFIYFFFVVNIQSLICKFIWTIHMHMHSTIEVWIEISDGNFLNVIH